MQPWPQKASGIQADRGLHTRVGNIKKREIILASRRPGKIFTARLFRLARNFFFFWATSFTGFFLLHPVSFSLTNIFSLTFYFSLSLSLPIVRSIFSIRFPVLQSGEFVQPIPKLTVLRSTKLDDRRKIWYRVGRGNVPGNGLALRLG